MAETKRPQALLKTERAEKYTRTKQKPCDEEKAEKKFLSFHLFCIFIFCVSLSLYCVKCGRAFELISSHRRNGVNIHFLVEKKHILRLPSMRRCVCLTLSNASMSKISRSGLISISKAVLLSSCKSTNSKRNFTENVMFIILIDRLQRNSRQSNIYYAMCKLRFVSFYRSIRNR